MIQIGNKPTEDEIIATLLRLYADQNNVDIVNLVITVPSQKEDKKNGALIRQFDSLESFIKSLE